jgi:SpoVK/Ycf46/Vps4 family AAA+-type ATPase
LHDDINLQQICEYLPSYVTGADIYDTVSKAYSQALQHKLEAIQLEILQHNQQKIKNQLTQNQLQIQEQIDENMVSNNVHDEINLLKSYLITLPKESLFVRITQENLVYGAQMIKPSVTLQDLQKYEQLLNSYDNAS